MHKPNKTTKKQVARLRATGMSHSAIAEFMDISRDTLTKYYRYELDHGADSVIDSLLEKELTAAEHDTSEGQKARHFLLTKLGRKTFGDRTEVEITAPITVEAVRHVIVEPPKSLKNEADQVTDQVKKAITSDA